MTSAPIARATAACASVAAIALGSTFHSIAGGGLPGPIALAMCGFVVHCVTGRCLRRIVSNRRLAVAVGLGQAVLHTALTATAGHSHVGHVPAGLPPVTAERAAAPGTLADALNAGIPADAVATDPVALALHRIGEELTLAHTSMAVGHFAAGAAVGLWLAIGHRALTVLVAVMSALHRRVHDRVAAFVTAVHVMHRVVPPLDALAAEPPSAADIQRPTPLTPPALARADVRRGPPDVFTLAA